MQNVIIISTNVTMLAFCPIQKGVMLPVLLDISRRKRQWQLWHCAEATSSSDRSIKWLTSSATCSSGSGHIFYFLFDNITGFSPLHTTPRNTNAAKSPISTQWRRSSIGTTLSLCRMVQERRTFYQLQWRPEHWVKRRPIIPPSWCSAVDGVHAIIPSRLLCSLACASAKKK
jgi:hypothetical protein